MMLRMVRVLEEYPKPPLTGLVGWTMCTAQQPVWVTLEGCWRLPGPANVPHLVPDRWEEVCHRVRKCQQYQAVQALEHCHLHTYRGPGSSTAGVPRIQLGRGGRHSRIGGRVCVHFGCAQPRGTHWGWTTPSRSGQDDGQDPSHPSSP